MLRLLTAAVMALCLSTSVKAQTYIQAAGTITAGNAFQTVIAASISRKFCFIQNTSARVLNIYVGTLGDATALKSFQIAASGGTWSCNSGEFVIPGTVNVMTTTTADTFVAAYAQ